LPIVTRIPAEVGLSVTSFFQWLRRSNRSEPAYRSPGTSCVLRRAAVEKYDSLAEN